MFGRKKDKDKDKDKERGKDADTASDTSSLQSKRTDYGKEVNGLVVPEMNLGLMGTPGRAGLSGSSSSSLSKKKGKVCFGDTLAMESGFTYGGFSFFFRVQISVRNVRRRLLSFLPIQSC